MKYIYLIISFAFVIAGSQGVQAQATMGFENLTTTQTCTTVICQYVDPDSRFSAHDLQDAGGVPVSSPTSGTTLGFSARFTPSRPNIAEFSDGQFFGYAGAATVSDDLGQNPTEGAQAYMMEDTDGEITLTFDLVDLSGVNNAMFSMDYIVSGGFEVTSGVNDLLLIEIEITGCPSATTLTPLFANGDGSGGATNLNGITDDTWFPVSQNLAAYQGCRAQLKITVDNDSSTEEFAIDNIVFTAGTALPVEFMDIAANQRKDAVVLDWATATETDNRGFSVERSTDGRSFTPIGWVDGSGEAETQINYEFEDSNVRMGQAYYYRLRQEDFDGAFAYSSIVDITLVGETNRDVAGQLFPNPAVSGQSNIELYPTEAGDWMVTVIDVNGKVLTETKHTLAAGYNLVPLNLVKHPVGAYLIRVAGKEQTVCRKVIR
ncbi:T9SS type A sorting domain-containing protein [Neolewinella persica]|uniref:T9SS type A sorting domain-containing protein n=1 Tax=Neolewinella persica TaxID=70998 RepID=UPI000378F560|nr:T9SS type A sorting domain-containing protein [Neolewinella persica]